LAYFKKSHAWLTTYAPARHPEYVVTVLVEHGGHGGSAAGPIAAKIYQWLYYHGYFKHHPLEEVQKELAKKREDLNATQSPDSQAPKLRMDQTQSDSG